MIAQISRVAFRLCLALVLTLVALAVPGHAEDKQEIRVGTLKHIHGNTPYFYEKFAPPGTTIEVVPF
jgi:NitT/TauT family transport system substrate-binding protein